MIFGWFFRPQIMVFRKEKTSFRAHLYPQIIVFHKGITSFRAHLYPWDSQHEIGPNQISSCPPGTKHTEAAWLNERWDELANYDSYYFVLPAGVGELKFLTPDFIT